MIVQSGGALQTIGTSSTPPGFGVAFTGLEARPYRYRDFASEQYGLMFATDPNLRIPISFLAGNVAQLGIHVFRRISDTDRVRLADHQLAQWLAKPNPGTTTYRLIEALLGDLGVYQNAYWLKVRYDDDTGARAVGLLRLPPEQMWIQGGLLPSAYVWRSTTTGAELTFAPSEIVAFGGYNPLDPLMGLSHMTTLDRVIREDAAASAHREYYWRNASRHEGVIERPKDSAKWTPTQKQSFREQWQQRFAGSGNSGSIAVLEDGMSFKPVAFSPKDSEFIQGGKLRREVTAAEYNVPQPSVGILDHATFSNIREQHKQLYQDSLGPTLEMITQEIERQLLIECTDQENIYIEFNIAAKLQGSFEEQANAIRLLVGRPIMTPNEARARLNLPGIKDDPTADQLAPQQGGPTTAAAPETPIDAVDPEAPDAASDDGANDPADDTTALVAHVVDITRRRQYAALSSKPEPARSSIFFDQIARWNTELAADLAPLIGVDEARRVAEYTNAETVPRARPCRGDRVMDNSYAYARVMAVALDFPWNITPRMLSVVANILARCEALNDSPTPGLKAVRDDAIQAAVANRKNLPQPRVGSVAVIPVYGVLAPKASAFTDISGATSYDTLSQQLDKAVNDKGVRTIVLDVDSPGGSVAGNQELAAEVMRARTKKPIVAQAQYLMASAAYQIGSAATEIVAAPSAQVGSIGTYSIHNDLSAALEQLGIKRTYISAGTGKVDGNETGPLTDAAFARRLKSVTEAYDAFVNTVVRGRGNGTSESKVRDTWGAHVYGAREAKDLGLVDKIATLDQTLERLLDTGDTADRAALAAFRRDDDDAPVDTSQARVRAGSDQDRRREGLGRRLVERQIFESQLSDLTE